MSVLIKGMEMPEAGQTITIAVNWDGSLYARLEPVGHWCPLVEVPPHGRLIDADALFKRMFVGADGQRFPDKDVDGWEHSYTFRGIKHEILSAPTIIEAGADE